MLSNKHYHLTIIWPCRVFRGLWYIVTCTTTRALYFVALKFHRTHGSVPHIYIYLWLHKYFFIMHAYLGHNQTKTGRSRNPKHSVDTYYPCQNDLFGNRFYRVCQNTPEIKLPLILWTPEYYSHPKRKNSREDFYNLKYKRTMSNILIIIH